MRLIPPMRPFTATRVTVVLFGLVATAFIGRFLWDDVISAEDVPRAVVVDGVAIGNTDRATAAARLAGLRVDRNVTLTFADESRTATLHDWGVVLDVESTLDRAADTRGGFPVRFLRWGAAVVRDRTVDPVWICLLYTSDAADDCV